MRKKHETKHADRNSNSCDNNSCGCLILHAEQSGRNHPSNIRDFRNDIGDQQSGDRTSFSCLRLSIKRSDTCWKLCDSDPSVKQFQHAFSRGYSVSLDSGTAQSGAGPSFTFSNLSPGPHIIRAALVNPDGSQLNPAVEKTLNVNVPIATNPVPEKSFTIQESSFKFDVSTINVNKGDKVTIIASVPGSTAHDICVDGYFDSNGNTLCTTPVSGGSTSSVSFIADKAGTFAYYCNIDGHRQLGMQGQLTVQ